MHAVGACILPHAHGLETERMLSLLVCMGEAADSHVYAV